MPADVPGLLSTEHPPISSHVLLCSRRWAVKHGHPHAAPGWLTWQSRTAAPFTRYACRCCSGSGNHELRLVCLQPSCCSGQLHERAQRPAGIWRVSSCFACASFILVQAFEVSQAEADSFDQQHPAPERPSTAKPSPAKAAAGGGGGGSRGRPAKRAKVAQTSESSSDSEEDAEAEEGAAGAEEDGEQQQQQQQQQQQEEQEEQRGKPRREQKADVQQGGGGLTEMERQRLELIKRNREVSGAPAFALLPTVCVWTVLPAIEVNGRQSPEDACCRVDRPRIDCLQLHFLQSIHCRLP